MTAARLWKSVEFVKQVPRAAKPVGNVSDMLPHAWHTLGTDLFYWNKINCSGGWRLLLQILDCEKTS